MKSDALGNHPHGGVTLEQAEEAVVEVHLLQGMDSNTGCIKPMSTKNNVWTTAEFNQEYDDGRPQGGHIAR